MPHEVWSKVMFLHLSVILFTRGIYPPPRMQTPPRYYGTRLTSEQCASYWNVYLLQECHSSKMSTASSSSHIRRSLHQAPSHWARHHPTLPLGPCTPTPDQAPPNQAPPHPPRTRHPPRPGTPHGPGTPL